MSFDGWSEGLEGNADYIGTPDDFCGCGDAPETWDEDCIHLEAHEREYRAKAQERIERGMRKVAR